MNKELELEAEKYAKSQKMEGFDSQMRRETFTRYSLEVAYEKGATSKYVEKQKLEFAIEQLKEVDFNMCKLLRQESINFDLSQEEATYKWRRTKWHLEIISKIKELEQKLSEL